MRFVKIAYFILSCAAVVGAGIASNHWQKAFIDHFVEAFSRFPEQRLQKTAHFQSGFSQILLLKKNWILESSLSEKENIQTGLNNAVSSFRSQMTSFLQNTRRQKKETQQILAEFDEWEKLNRQLDKILLDKKKKLTSSGIDYKPLYALENQIESHLQKLQEQEILIFNHEFSDRHQKLQKNLSWGILIWAAGFFPLFGLGYLIFGLKTREKIIEPSKEVELKVKDEPPTTTPQPDFSVFKNVLSKLIQQVELSKSLEADAIKLVETAQKPIEFQKTLEMGSIVELIHNANESFLRGEAGVEKLLEQLDEARKNHLQFSALLEEHDQKIFQRETEVFSKLEEQIQSFNELNLQARMISLNAAFESTRMGASGQPFAPIADDMGSFAEKLHERLKEVSQYFKNATSAPKSEDSQTLRIPAFVIQSESFQDLKLVLNEIKSQLDLLNQNAPSEEVRIVTIEQPLKAPVSDFAAKIKEVNLSLNDVNQQLEAVLAEPMAKVIRIQAHQKKVG